ncbi:MAG: superoxide dismutase family protein [Actinomycetota bacterium]|nr:superoxide dismutase family protein [Actinomycetota bacterium]
MHQRVGRRALAVGLLTSLVGVGMFSTASSSAQSRSLIADVRDVNNETVGTLRLTPAGHGKTRVKFTGWDLSPGFHGFHIHTTGQCDPAATDTTGKTSPFFSAGGHYNPDPSKTHGSHAGDMPPLYVTADGTAALIFETDRLQARDLMDADGSAVVIHASPDNLAHIPATTPTGGERYHSHVDSVLGADTLTKATGDAGARFACGVLGRRAS